MIDMLRDDSGAMEFDRVPIDPSNPLIYRLVSKSQFRNANAGPPPIGVGSEIVSRAAPTQNSAPLESRLEQSLETTPTVSASQSISKQREIYRLLKENAELRAQIRERKRLLINLGILPAE